MALLATGASSFTLVSGHYQVSRDQDEHDPPVEEHTRPAIGLCTCGTSTKLARVLLLCVHWLYASHRTTWPP